MILEPGKIYLCHNGAVWKSEYKASVSHIFMRVLKAPKGRSIKDFSSGWSAPIDHRPSSSFYRQMGGVDWIVIRELKE